MAAPAFAAAAAAVDFFAKSPEAGMVAGVKLPSLTWIVVPEEFTPEPELLPDEPPELVLEELLGLEPVELSAIASAIGKKQKVARIKNRTRFFSKIVLIFL